MSSLLVLNFQFCTPYKHKYTFAYDPTLMFCERMPSTRMIPVLSLFLYSGRLLTVGSILSVRTSVCNPGLEKVERPFGSGGKTIWERWKDHLGAVEKPFGSGGKTIWEWRCSLLSCFRLFSRPAVTAIILARMSKFNTSMIQVLVYKI